MFTTAIAFVRPAVPYILGAAAGAATYALVRDGVPAARAALANRKAQAIEAPAQAPTALKAA